MPRLKRSVYPGLMLVLGVSLSGCATRALWEEGRFARFHEPATPAHVQLFGSKHKGDVLVAYDEAREGDDSVRRRAYWLRENQERVQARKKPKFVRPERNGGLIEIHPVTAPPNGVGEPERCAVVSTNGQGFTLYTEGKSAGVYELPVYADASGRVKQVALTPIAVAADATIVGGYLLVMVWAGGGLSQVH